MTFVELKGKQPFDWYKALQEENISEKRWKELNKLSEDWVTCACGNQCDIIPRSELDNSPKDQTLNNLGMDFNVKIREKDAEEALNILDLIELRSVFLIKKLTTS